jgi:maltokinase
MRDALAAFIADARWFGGKGRAFEVTSVEELALAPGVLTALVTLGYDDGSTDVYQLPLVSYAEPQERIAHALIGTWDEQFWYDAVHDRDAMHLWLEGFAGVRSATDQRLEFRRTDDHQPDLESHSTLYSGEQSNSSVAFGEDSLLKVFRRLTAGVNPDIEVHEALTRAGSTHVATLYGYLTADGTQLAMLQQFLRTASDGWGLAFASARNLFVEGDLHADEVGGDFAAEAHRLGATVAEVHTVLAGAFATVPLDLPGLAATMKERLAVATGVVPELAAHAEALTERFDAVATLAPGLAQRIHGDLHLGQTLRTSLGWKLVDFEGEPAKELAERVLPDSPWRDVAGMIRSFGYAATAVARDLETGQEDANQIGYRAGEWVAHNVRAFLDGYTDARGVPISADERILLDAYVADKAVYEATYEARNRPDWLVIPLAALDDLARSAP